jgi:adenylate cyclase
MERRLSAIMAADVVGYSRLMGANEAGTLAALTHRRTEVIEPRIAGSNGRVVKLTGDGILAEFPSVVDAVECALAVQREMKSRNVEIPEDRRIELRIGIHLGDVIAEDGDIFGDGVNIAARIESAGRPGGVAVSAAVKDNVGNRLDVGFEDMGEHHLKNIEQPIRLYNVGLATPANAPAGAGSVSVADGPVEEAKPSIAVLPFDNMSGDPEQEFFSDGITEDIITDLSKISGLFVVGRNTSFTYKGKALQLQTVASELGVKYLLEGSVRKVGERVRITGQLIDGPTGGHVWADRYDRDLTDIFAIQDEITGAIVEQLRVRLLPEEKKAIAQAPTSDVEAYQLYLRGREYFHRTTRSMLRLARRQFVAAADRDPEFARAYAGIANCDTRLASWYGEPIPTEDILVNADKAIALDPNLSDAHAARGIALSAAGRDPEAVAAFEKAIELDPNNFEAHYFFGHHSIKMRRYEKAAGLLVRAGELNPDDVQSVSLASTAYRALGHMKEFKTMSAQAIRRGERAISRQPENSRAVQMTFTVYSSLGDRDNAVRLIEHALAIDPDDTHLLYNAACASVMLGDKDRGIDLLSRWVGRVGADMHDWMRQDVDFESIRDDPRFRQLLAGLDGPLAIEPKIDIPS